MLILLLLVSSVLPASFSAEASLFAFTPGVTAEAVHRPDNAHTEQTLLHDRIMTEFGTWKGIRYRLGGDSRQGIDCSAFTRRVFLRTLHQTLPRTAGEQSHTGQRVTRNNLRAGDLVFFRTHLHTRHVGIYVGNGDFIHASSSQGVTLSHLGDRYWQAHYTTARQVYPAPDVHA